VPADDGAGVAAADAPDAVPPTAATVVAEASVVGAAGEPAEPEDAEPEGGAEGGEELAVLVAPEVEAAALGAALEFAPAAEFGPAFAPEADVEPAPVADAELVLEADAESVPGAEVEAAAESAAELVDDAATPLLAPTAVLAPSRALVAAPEEVSAAECGAGLLGDGLGVAELDDWLGTVAGATGGVIPEGGATGLCAAGIAGTGTVVSTTVGAVDAAPTRPRAPGERGTAPALPAAPGVCRAGIELVSTGIR
jgi:hypothetical protein